MPKRQWFWWAIVSLMIGCGPDPIFLRPALDTPAQHLANGNALLDQEKWRDAGREFERAGELDPFFTEAYVGLAIALGGIIGVSLFGRKTTPPPGPGYAPPQDPGHSQP